MSDLNAANDDTTLEFKLRDAPNPHPKTEEELAAYIKNLVEMSHTYGSCVYAMSLAGEAAFNFMASKLGVTGFQASCADLTLFGRIRGWDGPFMVLQAEESLYPQYSLHAKLDEAIKEWGPWRGDAARKKLATNDVSTVHPDVWAKWLAIAAENPPKAPEPA